MTIEQAQREVRSVYMNGSVGQAVAGGLWLLSASFATWFSPTSGIWILVLGGVCIFPITQLVLRMLGRRCTLDSTNPMRWLAMQIAFTIPLNLPLAGAATLHRPSWFYPACMLIVGAHYLPFTFLYGMWAFNVLGGLLVAGGLMLGLYVPGPPSLGGWLTGVVLVLFALVATRLAPRAKA